MNNQQRTAGDELYWRLFFTTWGHCLFLSLWRQKIL